MQTTDYTSNKEKRKPAGGNIAPGGPPQKRSPTVYFGLRENIPHHVYVGAGIIFIAAILITWEIITRYEMVRPLFLPAPVEIMKEGFRQIYEGILVADASVSIYRIVMGWFFATILAVPIGILMGNFKFFEGLDDEFLIK